MRMFIILFLLVSGLQAAELDNADFSRAIKNNKIPGWSLALHGNPVPKLEAVEGHEKIARAAVFTIEKSAELSGSLEQRVKLKPNTKYYASMWSKTSQANGTYLEIAQLDENRKKGNRFSANSTNTGNQWRPVVVEFTTGSTGEIMFCMRFFLTEQYLGNTVYLAAPAISEEMPQAFAKQGLELVPTFENCSVYYYPETGDKTKIRGKDDLTMKYRPAGSQTWLEAFPPSFDPGETSWRGSIVFLKENSEYEVRLELLLSDGNAKITEGKFKTWNSEIPVAREIRLTQKDVANGQLILKESGSREGWLKYTADGILTGKEGENAVIKVIGANYVWLDGLTIHGGGARHGIELADSHNLKVSNCDISDYGRVGPRLPEKDGKFYLPDGQYINYDAGICVTQSGSLVIERNYIHDPRTTANGWFFSHPAGPQGIYLWGGGGTVIRFNDFIGSDPHRWNDAIESRNNGSEQGGPYRDCDVYGNLMFMANDDGIELDGGQMNIRTYFNRFEGYHCAISTAPCLLGPSYIFRNLMAHPGDFYNGVHAIIKNNYSVDGKGQIFVFNNTLVTPHAPAYSHYARKKLGAPYDGMIKGTTRNNLMLAGSAYMDRVFEWKNDFRNDQFWSDELKEREQVEKKHRQFDGIAGFSITKPEFNDIATGDYRVKNPQPGTPVVNFTSGNPLTGAFQNDGIEQLPYRPLKIKASAGELNFQSGGAMELNFTVANNGDKPCPYTIRKNRVFDWFEVTPTKGTLAPGKEIIFTVKLNPAAMQSAIKYKGMLLITDESGMSRPVSVYADYRQDPARLANDARLMAEAQGPFPAGEELTREMDVPADGVYYLLARVKPDAKDRDEVSFSVNGDEMKSGLARSSGSDWKWICLRRTQKTYEHFPLKKGTQSLKLKHNGGLQIDRIVLTPQPELLIK